MDVPFEPGLIFRLVDVAGVLANGLMGASVARSKHFDLVGFATLAIISGLGGGLIRDVLLGVRPVALVDPAYLTAALAAALIGYVVVLEGVLARRTLLVLDMLVLGCWSATGTIKAADLGLGPVPSVLLGVITAVGGGMLRDIAVGRTPAVFGGNTLYATVGVLGSIEALILHDLGQRELGMALSIVTCSVLGVLARRRRWMLPEPATVRLSTPRIRTNPKEDGHDDDPTDDER